MPTVAYLRTEQGTVGFLLTQTEGGRVEGWMKGWMEVRRKNVGYVEGGRDRQRVQRGVAGMCSLGDKVGGSRGGTHTLLHTPTYSAVQPGGKLWNLKKGSDRSLQWLFSLIAALQSQVVVVSLLALFSWTLVIMLSKSGYNFQFFTTRWVQLS